MKYERVKLPQQEELPVCFVVDMSADELKDGSAKTFNRTSGFIEESWRP